MEATSHKLTRDFVWNANQTPQPIIEVNENILWRNVLRIYTIFILFYITKPQVSI